jgi:cephalosporin-C deacetylase-like acetyl esterase
MTAFYSLMKYLTPYELDHIRFLAHNDQIPYDEISNYYKIDRHDLKKVMRFLLNDQDYLNWKKISKKNKTNLPSS